jgi:hypothetical protein
VVCYRTRRFDNDALSLDPLPCEFQTDRFNHRSRHRCPQSHRRFPPRRRQAHCRRAGRQQLHRRPWKPSISLSSISSFWGFPWVSGGTLLRFQHPRRHLRCPRHLDRTGRLDAVRIESITRAGLDDYRLRRRCLRCLYLGLCWLCCRCYLQLHWLLRRLYIGLVSEVLVHVVEVCSRVLVCLDDLPDDGQVEGESVHPWLYNVWGD